MFALIVCYLFLQIDWQFTNKYLKIIYWGVDGKILFANKISVNC